MTDSPTTIKSSSYKKKYFKGDDYKKVIECCQKLNIETLSGKKRQKEYPELLQACNKKKKSLLKDTAKFLKEQSNSLDEKNSNKITKDVGYEIDNLKKKLIIIDKVIKLINDTVSKLEQKNSISKYMSSDNKKKKIKIEKNEKNLSKYTGRLIDQYSAIATS